ncbi:hypothetical protein [Nonomuraea roseoviolacea]|uniref:hypothetical protein n=1 Tax=Nonomuraea roseoviolacea TaxID=103837 RepID=UPI0031D1FAC1
MEFQERRVSERLDDFLAQDAKVMQSVRPPIPNIGKVAPRFGYRQRVIGLDDVVRVDETFKPLNGDPLVQRPGFTSSALPGWSSA